MTAKILTRQSFSKATNYVFKDGRSEVIDSRGIVATDPQTAAACFKMQAIERPEIKSPVGHICISFHPDDTPRMTNDLMVEICEAYMKEWVLRIPNSFWSGIMILTIPICILSSIASMTTEN